MLRLYYADCSGPCPEVNLGMFSAYRREKLASIREPGLRKQMIAAEQLLIYAMWESDPLCELPLTIQADKQGKPRLVNGLFYFSLSHSGSYAACALSDHEVGLDIQKNTAPKETLLRRVFTEEERQYIVDSDEKDIAFTRLWCLKESYVKATGEGFSQRFDALGLKLSESFGVQKDMRAQFWVGEGREYQAAVCTLEGNDPKPEYVKLVELGW